jgi:hypothetical protein
MHTGCPGVDDRALIRTWEREYEPYLLVPV